MEKEIKANAEMTIQQMRPLSHMDFGYNRESVEWLEGYIERLRQSGGLADESTKDNLANVFGSFLGECVIRCHGGAWTQREGIWCVAFDSSNEVFPFAKVAKQMESGVEDGIGSFFRAIPVLFTSRVRKVPELSVALKQTPKPVEAPAAPHPAMEYAPAVKSANPKRKFQIGQHTAILFDNIVSIGSVRYLYMISVFENGQQPCFYVTSEVNPTAKRFGGGSHFLGVFDGSGHINRGDSDDWADEEKFTAKALQIIKEKFVGGVSTPPPPALLADILKDQLMAYFGDQEDEAAVIAQLREDIKNYSGTFYFLHDGIIQFLYNPDLDCVHLVQNCANRNVHGSRKEAKTWLLDLFARLFVNPAPITNQGQQLKSSSDPEFKEICKERLKELSNSEMIEMITFAQELLVIKDLPLNQCENLVQQAMWLTMEGFDEDGERRPRPEDVANKTATATFLRSLIVKEVVRMALNEIPPSMQQQTMPNARMFVCSRCRTEHPDASIHVVPTWNEHILDFVTSYRCDECWIDSLAETQLKVAVLTEDVREKFCQYLDRHGFDEAAQTIRQASLEEATNIIRKILDNLEDGTMVLR